MKRCTGLTVLCLLAAADAFAPSHSFIPKIHTHSKQRTYFKADDAAAVEAEEPAKKSSSLVKQIWNRMNTLESAGFNQDAQVQPISLKQGALLCAIGFGYKWYRARFINKIPVWDRQPQWNTVITNREQEKELKAFTCKSCGATLFIARHRNWFFEGDTGLGGLGCYSCGAKGKDNFIMDRDRIVDDVGDDDDYFDYERPLDFVTAAERRAALKAAGGDEEKANQDLVKKAEDEAREKGEIEDAEVVADADATEGEVVAEVEATEDKQSEPAEEKSAVQEKKEEVVEASVEEEVSIPEVVPEPPAPAPAPVAKKKKVRTPAPAPAPVAKKKKVRNPPPAEELDLLDMDDF